VGGGLTGMAIAWGLVRRGRRGGGVDGGGTAHPAPRGKFAPGWGARKSPGTPGYTLWTMAAPQRWGAFAAALSEDSGLDVAFRRPGGLHLLLSERELESRANALLRLHNQPGMQAFEYRMLDHDAVKKMLPQVGPEVAGASFCPFDGHVNALRTLRALHVAVACLGGSYRPNHAVERIETRAGEFRLTTAAGEIAAGRVVLAAGLGNARLAPMVGLEAPVRPQRGQIIVTEKVAPFMNHIVHTI